MSRTVKIYGLFHPINGDIFYVGATRKSLKERLGGHLSAKAYSERGISKKRKDLIDSIKKLGETPIIKILQECEFEDAQNQEKIQYEKYVSMGFELLQSGTDFHYCKTVNRVTIFSSFSNLKEW